MTEDSLSIDRTTEATYETTNEDIVTFTEPSEYRIHLTLQSERIDKILKEVINKTMLVIYLPSLVKEYNMLERILTSGDYVKILRLFEHIDIAASYNKELQVEEGGGLKSLFDGIVNSKITDLIQILMSYNEIYYVAQQYIETYNDNSTQLPDNIKYYNSMVKLREVTVSKCNNLPEEEMSKSHYRNNIQARCSKLTQLIKEFNDKHSQRQKEFELLSESKQISLVEKQKQFSNLKHSEIVQYKVELSEFQCEVISYEKSHKQKLTESNEELENLKEYYEKYCDLHLNIERAMISKRHVMENLFNNCLNKYDRDIGRKQTILNRLNALYKCEQSFIQQLERQIDVQHMMYTSIVEERERECAVELERKVQQMLLEHYVRVIQRTWLAYHNNRYLSKKGKKKKKKIKQDKKINT